MDKPEDVHASCASTCSTGVALARSLELMREKQRNVAVVYSDGTMIDLKVDGSVHAYHQHLEGPGMGTCLIRDANTDEIVGISLPLKSDKMQVVHEGPLWVNTSVK